ncbi:MAG: hypothetical protein EHM70_01175 [Chloroflexota bacterium]|nr:MAG: hypothetical protein EHM70_01175 [Chloroflexota bacterium]
MPSTGSHPLSGTINRRDFLKLGGFSLAGLLVPPVRPARISPELSGRVLEGHIWLYDTPSYEGKKVKVYWKDTVLPISAATIGDGKPAYNRTWYRIGEEGYTHSSVIQPVRTIVNEPVADIPEGGRLAEVTVPYTDAHWGPGKESEVGYRYYYETTYWVIDMVRDSQGEAWYCTLEDKWQFKLYAPAAHMRLIPPEELSPLSPELPMQDKRLEVRTEDQIVIAYERNRPIFMSRCSTGAKFRDGNYETQPGRYITFHKRPTRHMAAGDLEANGYDLPGVPWVTYITEEGVSFHGTYWHNDFGHKRSHGCINMPIKAARWLFRWTIPYVPSGEEKVYEDYGTPVDIV